MGKFSRQIDEWAKQTRGDLEQGARDATYGLFEALSDNTPVRTGYLRGSWSVNYTPSNPPEGDYDKTGAKGKRSALDVLQEYKTGDTIYIINSAYYARFVEFGTKNRWLSTY
jgi:hypothetical protein